MVLLLREAMADSPGRRGRGCCRATPGLQAGERFVRPGHPVMEAVRDAAEHLRRARGRVDVHPEASKALVKAVAAALAREDWARHEQLRRGTRLCAPINRDAKGMKELISVV